MSETLNFTMRMIDRFSAPIKKMGKGVGVLNEQVKKLGRGRGFDQTAEAADKAASSTEKLKSRMKGLLKVSSQLSMASTAAMQMGRGMARALAAPIREAGSFEQAMSRVRARTSGFSQEQIDKAKELGATTKFTAVEAAQGMEKLAMAGFTAKEQTAALADVLNLDAASGMNNVGGTADIVTDIMGGFQIGAEDLTKSADTMVRVLNSSNTTLAGLGETMKFAAPVAKKLGVSLKDTAVLAGALGDAGIKGSQAGTALRLMMTNFAGASKPAVKAMKKFGIVTSDANDDLLPIQDLLGNVVDAFGDMGNTKKTKLARDLFGQRGISAGLVLLEGMANKAGGSITKLNAAVADTETTAASTAADMEKNLFGKLTLAASAASALGIAIGEQLTDEIGELVEGVTKLIGSMTKWVKENKSTVVTIFKVSAAIAAMALTVGTIASVLATAALAAVGFIGAMMGIAKVGVVLGGLVTAVKFIGLVIAGFFAIPLATVAAVAAIAALGVALYVWRDEAMAAMKSVVSAASAMVDDLLRSFAYLPEMFGFGGGNVAMNVQSHAADAALAGGDARLRGTSNVTNSKRQSTVIFKPVVNVDASGADSSAGGEKIGTDVNAGLRSMLDSALATQGG